jgi:DNA-binding MarR family transcriptional regulator
MMSSEIPLAARLHAAGEQEHLLQAIIRTNQVLINGFSRLVGMPASRLLLMRELANAPPAGIGILKIARQLGINAAAVTRSVKQMEQQGFIKRRADGKDRRRSYITLSAKGVRTCEQLHAHGHELERSLSSVISSEETAVAVRVMAVVRTSLEKLQQEELVP